MLYIPAISVTFIFHSHLLVGIDKPHAVLAQCISNVYMSFYNCAWRHACGCVAQNVMLLLLCIAVHDVKALLVQLL